MRNPTISGIITIYHSLQLILNPQEAILSPKGMKLGSISLRGFFNTREELDEYEKMWHIYIYQPTWNELKSKVSYVEQTRAILIVTSILHVHVVIGGFSYM
jgi:hypothetical protein